MNKNIGKVHGEIRENGKTILPVYFPVPVSTYLHHLLPLSIILTNNSNRHILHNHYIQLYSCDCSNTNVQLMTERDDYPKIIDFFPNMQFLNSTTLYLSVVGVNNHLFDIPDNEMIDQIMKWIDHGLYLIFNIDESLIPGTILAHLNQPMLHTIFLYGYDAINNLFKSINFDSKRRITFLDISFEDFYKAFISPSTRNLLQSYDWGKNCRFAINVLQINAPPDKKLNLALIKEGFTDFLNARNSTLEGYDLYFNTDKKSVWGIDVYNSVVQYLNVAEKWPFFDIRIFSALYEHKQLMFERIKVIRESGMVPVEERILNRTAEALQIAQRIKSASLKYFLTKKSQFIEQMIHQVNILRDMDHSILEKIVNRMN